MVPIWNKVKLRFQAKVLVPVVTVLVLVLLTIVWLVSQRMQAQLQSQARQSLLTLESVFTNSLQSRIGDLRAQFRSIPNQAGFLYLAKLAIKSDNVPDQEAINTINGYLKPQLDALPKETSVALLSSYHGRFMGGATRDSAVSVGAFHNAATNLIAQTIETGNEQMGLVEYDHRFFYLVSIPFFDPAGSHPTLLVALTLGIEIGDSLAQQLKLPNSEIVFIANNRVLASTLQQPEQNQQILGFFGKIKESDSFVLPPLAGEHFAGLPGKLRLAAAQGTVEYLLLTSSEHLLRQLEETRRLLVLVGAFGILLSTLIIWLVIHHATRPLIQLRNSAEAVGQGDFSHRITIVSQDELGELAQVFNRMTENLQTSTTQLEQTVETLRTTQARLMQSEKLSAIGEFVAGVAHELNNPLTALIGFSELLQMRATDETTRSSLNRISSSAERCHKIVQSLLSFARQHPPERKLTDVNSLIDAVLEILIYDLRTSNIKVEKDFSQQLPRLMVDPHQIQQVFLNIVHNARQAIQAYQPHGNIRITTRALPGKIQVRFQDDGPGISPENLKKIFDPFFTTKPVGKGTGLGLSLSYGIIHEHGGTITAESQPGKGTAFIIEFPVAAGDAQAASAAPVAPVPALANEGSGRKILVVDDEEDILNLIRQTLTREGYQVQTFLDGEAALRSLEKENYDLIISDWKMPGLGGQQLYEQTLKTNPAAAEKFIFMTGDLLSEKTQQFLRDHQKLCLAKPFSLRDFRATIIQALEKK